MISFIFLHYIFWGPLNPGAQGKLPLLPPPLNGPGYWSPGLQKTNQETTNANSAENDSIRMFNFHFYTIYKSNYNLFSEIISDNVTM